MTMAVASPASAQSKVAALGWMAGCWQHTTSGILVEEQWTQPAGGMLLGVGRTTRRDSTISFEFTRIFQRGRSLIFEARPNGLEPVEFVAHRSVGRTLDFRNPKHDFPQRVGYRFISADSLRAFIEGPVRGRMRRVDFAYGRVPCEAIPTAP